VSTFNPIWRRSRKRRPQQSGAAVRHNSVLGSRRLNQDEIVALFRLPSSNSVAQMIRRTKAQDAQTLKVLKNQANHK
jgi:hypothetical protein